MSTTPEVEKLKSLTRVLQDGMFYFDSMQSCAL